MSKKLKKVYLYIRRLSDHEEIERFDVTGKSDRTVEKIMFGILRNLNMDKYFVDDDEVTGK